MCRSLHATCTHCDNPAPPLRCTEPLKNHMWLVRINCTDPHVEMEYNRVFRTEALASAHMCRRFVEYINLYIKQSRLCLSDIFSRLEDNTAYNTCFELKADHTVGLTEPTHRHSCLFLWDIMQDIGMGISFELASCIVD